MYDDIECVDTYTDDLNRVLDKYLDIISRYNDTNIDRRLSVNVFKGKNRYAEIDIVDEVYEDVVLLTVFKTTLNNLTGKYIIPLDTMVNEDITLRSIKLALEDSMFYTMIGMKSTQNLIQ